MRCKECNYYDPEIDACPCEIGEECPLNNPYFNDIKTYEDYQKWIDTYGDR